VSDRDAATRPRFWRFKCRLLVHLLDQYADALEAQGKDERAVTAVLNLMDALTGGVHPRWRLD